MGAQILLIFGARFALQQRHILLEGHRLAMQTCDRDRLDEPLRFPDVEALLCGIDPARDPLASQASAYVVVLVVDGQIAPGADRPRKSSLVHLHEPVVWIDRLWNLGQRRERRAGHPWRLIATGAREGSDVHYCNEPETPR
jgi:hypothetical protein